jgi:hypothetical protein
MENITIRITPDAIVVHAERDSAPAVALEPVSAVLELADPPTGFVKLDVSGNELPDDAADWPFVLDRAQGLIWSADDTRDSCDWANADAACRAAAICGAPGRLPTREELRGIVNYDEANPAAYTRYFRNVKPRAYWSSSAFAGYPDDCAWLVDFYYGGVYWGNRHDHACVRAVRSVASPVAGQ